MGIDFLSTFLSGTALVPGDLGHLLSNGLGIAGWLSLWSHIEMFSDEWWLS